MVGSGIRCPRCDGVRSDVTETRSAPERRVPIIARVRRCLECGHEVKTFEVLAGPGPRRVRLPDPEQLLATIRADRYELERSGS